MYVTGVTIEESYSTSGMVLDNQWSFVSIRFSLEESIPESELLCAKRRKGKLMFYVEVKLGVVTFGAQFS